MLAGFQSEIDSMFPTLRTLTPSEEDIETGAQKLKFGRVIRISDYRTEIFDMHDEKERKAYNALLLDLSRRSQLGVIRILVHDRQIMTRKDGSSGWFGYLEWMEYERKEENAPTAGKKEEDHGQAG